ncbi:unnamed protein product [Polarella glacialis]|uniref:Uncharacterized protein n=1 Tax=Polarella glacialis TaxID=89957 RepID=A0A813GB51_POLGL|nr:unnamed protein product [Polarella glacialis]CAE8706733.1 unnamed protein product [Polarella glacialis]
MAGCELLGTLGIAVQGAITVVCASAMLAVWHLESPRRPFATWAFDVSKQVVGAAYGKCWNIVQAEVFARFLRASIADQDQCVWYLMGMASDCFVTTALCWWANSLMRPVLLAHWGIDIGNYGGEVPVVLSATGMTSMRAQGRRKWQAAMPAPSWLQGGARKWLAQLGIWLLIITLMRLVVGLGLFVFQDSLYTFYSGVFSVLHITGVTGKTVFAVLVFPAFGDTLQIMVQDHFLKKPSSEETHLDYEAPILQLPSAI